MKNKYLRLVVVLSALLLSVSSLWAERVTQEDAALVAANFLNGGDSTQAAQAPGRNRPIRRVALAEEAQYYVYENADGNGWVMVAANDVVQPILAYSPTGKFNADKQPKNVARWLKGYNNQIKFAEENNIEATEEVKAKWKNLRKAPPVTAQGTVVVAPLIKTTWDQDDPYWNSCPKISGTNTLTGCVATAMAQVMNYWQWPETGEGSASVTVSGTKYTANFSSTTYDWANMIDHYTTYTSGTSTVYISSTPTTAQKNAVATLMYHCGVAANMTYGTSSSGAYTINWGDESEGCAENAFWKYFRYKKSEIKSYYRDGYSGSVYSSWTDANWIAMLKTELDAARPIMYAGADSEGGHSFVCDGYDDQNYFHFNWGWSGYCDGYYTVNNMVPGTGGSGAGNGSYNEEQDVIIGIVPDKPNITITWSVNGVTSTTTQSTGKLVLPTTTPSDCSGSGGKKFVGWTASSSLSGSAPDDLFTSGSGITVTENKTYYAVYAAQSGSGTPSSVSYSFSNKSWNASPSNWTSGKDGNGYNNSGVQVTTGTTGANATAPTSYNNITSIVVSYCTNASSGAGSITMSIGTSELTQDITKTGGTSARDLTFDFSSTKPSGAPKITASCTTNSIYVRGVTINYGGGASYSDYSLSCGAACALTSITLNTSSVKKTFVANETFTSEGLVVTANYSNCDSKTVTGSVTAPQMGTAGEKTVTVSYTENSVEKTATYKINVVNPYTVTYMACGEEFTRQEYAPGASLVLPTTVPSNNAGKSFAGWIASSSYTNKTTAPTYVTAGGAVNADVTYYAVFH